jgi:tetratricopeptide (TPR) repeat protein
MAVLKDNTTVTTLHLQQNQIGDIGSAAIGQGLASNKVLTYLNLQQNQIGDIGSAAIGQGLASNEKLTQLYLQQNQIGEEAVATLKTAGARLGTNLQLQSQQQPDVNAPKTSQEDFDLFMSVYNNDLDKIKELISKGYDFATTDAKGQNIVWYAVFFGRSEIINLLVESEVAVNFNQANKAGVSPSDICDFKGDIALKEIIDNHWVYSPSMNESKAKVFGGFGEASDVDVKEVANLIEGNERIGEASGKAILLLGNTGSGKSTLAHALSGVELQAITDDETGEIIIDALQPLDHIKIGNQMSSETTYPNKCKTSGVTIWDCPGFNDTKVAQEIANGFYIQKIFEKSTELKFVLVINEAELTTTKGSSFLNTIDQFIKSFRSIQEVESAVSLVITRVAPNKKLQQVKNLINKVLEENEQASSASKALMTKVINNHCIELLYKPKDEGIYYYDNIFDALDQSGLYIGSNADMANIIVSDKAKEYSAKLLSAAKGNFDKVLMSIVKAVLEPEKCMTGGGGNIFEQNCTLINEWIPKVINYDNSSLNAPAIKGYFLELKQIKALHNSLSPEIASIDEGMKVIGSLMKVFEEFAHGSDIEANRKVMQKYYKVLEQQYNYIKFFSEICEENLPEADGFKSVIKLCKGKLAKNMTHKVKMMVLDEMTDPAYYKEAISYLDTQNDSVACHKLKAKACIKLAEISEMSGDKGEALNHYIDSIGEDKKLPEIYEKMGQLFANQQDYKKAILCYQVVNDTYEVKQCFKDWLKIEPKNPEIMMMRGDHLTNIGAFNSSVKCYNHAASLYKNDQDKKDEALSKVAEILENNFNLADHFRHMVSEHDYFNFDMVNEDFVTNLMGDFSQSSQS